MVATIRHVCVFESCSSLPSVDHPALRFNHTAIGTCAIRKNKEEIVYLSESRGSGRSMFPCSLTVTRERRPSEIAHQSLVRPI